MRFSVEDRQNKGSITVEASIIVPIVILSITAVIFMGLLLYQRALIQSAADMAAEAGAAAWASGSCEIGIRKPHEDTFDKIQLYRRFFDGDNEERLECIENYALSIVSRTELLHPVNFAAEAVVKDYAVSRKLEVRIIKYYSLPIGNFLRIFGGSGTIAMHAEATASVDEPVEFIRTTDFILDIKKKLENNNPDIKDLGEKTRNTMNEVKGKIEKFIN